MVYVGIDPGLDGGIAILFPNGDVNTYVMPTKDMGFKTVERRDVDIVEVDTILRMDLAGLQKADVKVTLERVQARPRNGAQATFSFGFSFGKIVGLMEIKYPKFYFPRPQEWQPVVLGCSTDDKSIGAAFCKRTYPQAQTLRSDKARVPHSGITDAIAIMHYGRIRGEEKGLVD